MVHVKGRPIIYIYGLFWSEKNEGPPTHIKSVLIIF